MKRRRYLVSLLVRQYERGKSVRDLAKQEGVAPSTMYGWLKMYDCKFRAPTDEPSHRSKLTPGIARTVRKLYATGGYSEEYLGKLYGVSQRAISDVVCNKHWKDDDYEGVDRDRHRAEARPDSVRGNAGRVAGQDYGQGPGG